MVKNKKGEKKPLKGKEWRWKEEKKGQKRMLYMQADSAFKLSLPRIQHVIQHVIKELSLDYICCVIIIINP